MDSSASMTFPMVKKFGFLSRRKSIDRPVASDRAPAPETSRPRADSYSRTRNPSSSTAPRTSSSTLASSTSPSISRSIANSITSSEYSSLSECSPTPSIVTQTLSPLQKLSVLDDNDRLSPLLEDDPNSFNLIAQLNNENGPSQYSLETRSEQLFSKQHFEAILNHTPSLLRFSSFLRITRPKSLPVLIYFLDSLKALRAIKYANAVTEALEPIPGLGFSQSVPQPSVNTALEEKAKQALDVLVRDDLPAFITQILIQVTSVSITRRVTGNLPPLLHQASEGLAEVFCLTDPSRTDNPIIFASEGMYYMPSRGVL